MATAALVKCSAPSFKSHNKLRQHYKCLFEGYDTLRGVEMMQQYARRSKGAAEASKSEAESMASAATVPMKLCADCQTSKTPMWRKGPNGPKSLCNACGIRHKRNSRLRLNGESGGPKKLKSSRIARSGCCIHNPELSQEELKQRQKEKQKRLLLVLMQRQRQRNAQRRRPRTAAAERGGAAVSRSGREEVEAAAFLLLSLSSGVSVR